jgi:tetratricopeptide (TPR) repeat protein
MEPLFTFPRLHIGIYEEEHGHAEAAIEQLQQVIELTQQDKQVTKDVRSQALVYMSYAYNQLGDHASEQKYLNMAAQMQQR